MEILLQCLVYIFAIINFQYGRPLKGSHECVVMDEFMGIYYRAHYIYFFCF